MAVLRVWLLFAIRLAAASAQCLVDDVGVSQQSCVSVGRSPEVGALSLEECACYCLEDPDPLDISDVSIGNGGSFVHNAASGEAFCACCIGGLEPLATDLRGYTINEKSECDCPAPWLPGVLDSAEQRL